MKTKIIIILIFLNLILSSNIFGKDIVKSCFIEHPQNKDDYVIFHFPEDGRKPFGRGVETLLTITNKYELEIEIIQADSIDYCLKKMRDGSIDILPMLIDKDDRRNYMLLKQYDKDLHLGISINSKHYNMLKYFAFSFKEKTKIWSTNWTKPEQHVWFKNEN